tara:strand:- start:336 stop:722 length:387 start_codon:yes stop_codon:yes gene_type:complete
MKRKSVITIGLLICGTSFVAYENYRQGHGEAISIEATRAIDDVLERDDKNNMDVVLQKLEAGIALNEEETRISQKYEVKILRQFDTKAADIKAKLYADGFVFQDEYEYLRDAELKMEKSLLNRSNSNP